MTLTIIKNQSNPAFQLKHIYSVFIYISVLNIFLFIVGCSTSRQLPPSEVKTGNKLWDSLNLEASHHVGLSVYDVQKGKYLFNHRENNLFTPGSNVKLFTLYTALQFLDENIPAGYYQERKDTIVVWGGGDPGTKYPDIHAESPFINFLKKTDKQIVFSDNHFKSKRFGAGWSWDDFPYSFQTEKTAFPIYGNKIWIERSHDTVKVIPTYFNIVVSIKRDTLQKLFRNETGTHYDYMYDHRLPRSLISMPASLYQNDIRFIWKEAVGKDITFLDVPFVKSALQIDGSKRDTLLKWMMQESDNFVAEQLLLACALKQTGVMNEKEFIKQLLRGPFASMPDSVYWVDGSGLSRYNLLTPRSLVWVLDKILQKKGLEYIKSIFAAGGESGTILKDYINDDGEPYIYAKTGTLRNVYCLSGILITRTGKVLLFSWMNNQLKTDSSEIKNSMEIFLTYLRDQY
ncbi:MAG TPA: D-alanyl-D-alanine carboxypeptidase [Saprospiraceae bacterium]|nr:D-alanyl-D-alanine carboxypeptidase [Saprospiraceae bacterium]